MSSIPFAYSEEHGDILSPDDAYDQYWEGHLKDQRAFQCPGQNCKAQVTLANMYKNKEKNELRQSPHYRCSNHVLGCEYLKALEQSSRSGKKGSMTESDEVHDVFLTSKRKVKSAELETLDDYFNTDETNLGKKYRKYTARPKFHSIRPIVDRYFQHREKGDAETAEIKVDDKLFTYKTLFKGVWKQDIEEFEGVKLVWWGKAWINRLRDESGYRIRFNEPILSEGEEIHPSIIIKDKMVESYYFKKRISEYLNEDCAKGNSMHLCFVYSYPELSGKYINFNIDSLDLIDFESTEHLWRLTSS